VHSDRPTQLSMCSPPGRLDERRAGSVTLPLRGSCSQGPGAVCPNPDHHVWCNNGTYWLHATVEDDAGRRRIRRSLNTKDLLEARRRRDAFLAELARRPDIRLAIRMRNSRVRRDGGGV